MRKTVAAIVKPSDWHEICWYCRHDDRYRMDTYTYEELWQLQQECMKDANRNVMQAVSHRDEFIDGTSVVVGHIPFHVEEWSLLLALLTCNWTWTIPTRRVIAINVPRTPKEGDKPITLQHAAKKGEGISTRGLSEGEVPDILTKMGYQGRIFIRFFNCEIAEEFMRNMNGVQLSREIEESKSNGLGINVKFQTRHTVGTHTKSTCRGVRRTCG